MFSHPYHHCKVMYLKITLVWTQHIYALTTLCTIRWQLDIIFSFLGLNFINYYDPSFLRTRSKFYFKNKQKQNIFISHLCFKIRLHLWNKNDKIIYLFLQRENLCLMTLCSFLLLKNSVSYDKSNSISYFLFKTNYVLSKMLSSSSSHVTHIFTDHHAYYTK